jgi:hypothetical protein
MARVEFELTIPVLKREKTVHALDRASNVIGQKEILKQISFKQTDDGHKENAGMIINNLNKLNLF